MSHETPTLEAELRDRTGTRYSRRLRAAKRLPAVIYGHKTDPVSISVDENQVIELLHEGMHVLNVRCGGKDETCLVKDLQFGYLGDNVIHVDFARVNLDEEVTVNVHLHFVGEPASAAKTGAILTHDLTELEVTCKVKDIPDEIVVDISEMESTFTVGELTLPDTVTCDLPDITPVVHISFVHREEEEGEAVEVEAADAEPEVISESDESEKEEG